MEQSKKTSHILICITGGVGHLNPVLDLSKKIAAEGNTVTLVSSELQIHVLEHSIVNGEERFGGLDIRLVGLWDGYPVSQRPPVTADTIWEIIGNLDVEIGKYLDRMDSVDSGDERTETALTSAGPLSCGITDSHLWRTQNTLDRLSIPRYIFFSMSAFYVSLLWHVPQLVSQNLLELGPALSGKGEQEKLALPGFPELPVNHFPGSAKDRRHVFLACGHCLPGARGFLMNTHHGLEGQGIAALQSNKLQVSGADKYKKMPKLLPLGPLFSATLIEGMLPSRQKVICLDFLDSKPPASVLYVAFGTEASLPPEQILEMAMGLEASQQPFLWVLRPSLSPPPSNSSESASGTASPRAKSALDAMLPAGFRERTGERGLVFSDLAPQLAVLSHSSTGAFLSHCGWNSTMESMHHGVPMLAFPQGADQAMNCRLIVDKLKVGIELRRTKEPQNKGRKMVSKEDMEKSVRRMLASDEKLDFRARAGEVKIHASNAHVAAEKNLKVFLDEVAATERH